MFRSQQGQAELFICFCLFCLVIALCMYLSNNFDNKRRKWLLLMQIFTAVLLFNDALVYIFCGYAGVMGCFIVHISNFMVFVLSDVVMFFFHVYVCSYLFADEEWKNIRHAKSASYICATGVVLVIILQFTNFIIIFMRIIFITETRDI